MVTLYNVVSADDFIASKDGSEEFIPDAFWPQTLSFMRGFDSIVLGRRSYEALQRYDRDLIDGFEALPVRKFVATTDPNYEVKAGYELIHHFHDLSSNSVDWLVTSGPTLNNYLLEHSLVERIVLHQLPVSIFDGTKPFDEVYKNKFVIVSRNPIEGAEEIIYEIA